MFENTGLGALPMMAWSTNNGSYGLLILHAKVGLDKKASDRPRRAQLTEYSSGSVITGETGLAHSRTSKVNKSSTIMMWMQGCYMKLV